MKILDPHLKDGVHEWRDGKRFVKEGAKLYLEGTDTLAGRCVSAISRARSVSDCWRASASSVSTAASATFRGSRVVLWVKRLNV